MKYAVAHGFPGPSRAGASLMPGGRMECPCTFRTSQCRHSRLRLVHSCEESFFLGFVCSLGMDQLRHEQLFVLERGIGNGERSEL